MKYVLVCFALFFATPIAVFAQSDSIKLTAKFKFHDGIYQSAYDLKNNKPNQVSTELTKNAVVTDNVIQLMTDTNNSALKSAWCIVKEGVPYINYLTDSTKQNIHTFYKLQLQGKICYFSYSRNELRQVPMKVYDPQTQKLVYTSFIQNRERIAYRYIVRLSDGAIVPFNRINFTKWTADDKKVTATIADIKDDDELNARLFKILLIYNDRNTIWIKK
jgi:hypothetical protein